MTDARIDRDATLLARFLLARGVTSRSRIGVEHEGSYEMAVAALAVSKPSGPIDPRLSPAEAANAAMAFALGPSATDDWTRPLAWIDHALARLDAAEQANPDQKDRIRLDRHA